MPPRSWKPRRPPKKKAKRPSPPPAVPQPPAALNTFAGAYANGSFGKVTVSATAGSLALAITATGATLQLEPWSGDVFLAKLVGEGRFAAVVASAGPSPLGFAQFLVDGNGKFDRLRLTMQEGGQASTSCGSDRRAARSRSDAF